MDGKSTGNRRESTVSAALCESRGKKMPRLNIGVRDMRDDGKLQGKLDCSLVDRLRVELPMHLEHVGGPRVSVMIRIDRGPDQAVAFLSKSIKLQMKMPHGRRGQFSVSAWK